MDKKLFAFPLIAFFLLTGAGAAAHAFLTPARDPAVGGVSGAYHLTLSEANASSDGSSYLAHTDEMGNPIAFSYDKGSAAAGAHVELEAGGSLRNVDALTGIKAIRLLSSGSEVYLETGYRYDGLSDPRAIASSATVSFDGGANYFRLSAPMGATIEEVVITYDCVGLPLEETVRLEAEDFSTNLTGNYRADPLASGGGYVGSLDNGGQGVSFDYFAYNAGKRTVDIAYATGSPGSYHGVYLNGSFVTAAHYDENTGWFGDGRRFATVSIELEMDQGWNSIALLKDGHLGDANFGGWAEIDYIDVRGLELPFNPDDYEGQTTYIYDGELAHWHIASGKMPFKDEGNRLLYSVGEINEEGMGVDFENLALSEGRYNFKAYVGADGPRKFVLDVDGLEHRFEGDLTGGAFNRPLPVGDFEIDIGGEGPHRLSLTRDAGSDWFCIDYIVLTRIQ